MDCCLRTHHSEIVISTLNALESLIVHVPHLNSAQTFQPFIHTRTLLNSLKPLQAKKSFERNYLCVLHHEQ